MSGRAALSEAAGPTLLAVCAATALLLLNISAPNVALPEIGDELGADFSQTQLIIGAYSLTLAALLLTAGTLADLHGRRRLFVIGPLEGGLLTESLGWRWIFVVDVALAVPVAFVAVTRLRESSDPGAHGVDWAGVLTLTPRCTPACSRSCSATRRAGTAR